MMNEDKLLGELNAAQRSAVLYNDGPILVIAGAGSGKTRMLTHKIAYLIGDGVKPWEILALTFTNKAATEMKLRIDRLLSGDGGGSGDWSRRIYMGTFHSIFSRILRMEAERIGFTPQFTIYDEGDSESLIRTIVREMGLDDKKYKASSIHKSISLAKNNLEAVDGDGRVEDIYREYERRCRTANAIDFDDLLVYTYELFRRYEDVRQKWEERFRYILVDEYQDTNTVQQRVLELLTRKNKHICVVGDDAQSIYAFRGANLNNILSFEEVYPGTKVFKLEQNYRSTQTIVNAANSLISHNERQKEKYLFTESERGERLRVKQAYSDHEEATIVAKEVVRLKRLDGCDFDDFAVLYRTNAQSRAFEDAFLKQGIPYRVCGGLSFYQRKEVKDILAYFRLVVNPNDEEAFKRVVNYPARGIGRTSVEKVGEAARKEGVSMWQLCRDVETYSVDLNAGTKGKILGFVAMINKFRERLETDDAYALGHDIIMDSGIYGDVHSSKDVDAIARQENVDEFDNALNTFVEDRTSEERGDECGLYDFLQEVSLSTDLESEDEDGKEVSRVSLMTVHAAKGLEFGSVMVVGMDENIFPSARSAFSQEELEEERRLLYVAITRAERHCMLTCAKTRWRYGKMETFTPSRFLGEIDPSFLLVEREDTGGYRTKHVEKQNERRGRQEMEVKRNFTPVRRAVTNDIVANAGEEPYPSLKTGAVVVHQRFGLGKVLNLEGRGADKKATVEFENVGRKVLLLKFAKIDIFS